MSEEIKLRDIVDEILQTKDLNDDVLLTLSSIFHQTLFDSLQIIDKKMIIRYVFQPSNRSFYVINGTKDTKYLCLLEGDYCSCPSFNFSVLCKHQLAAKIAEALGNATVVEFGDNEYSSKVSYIESLSIRTPSQSMLKKGDQQMLQQNIKDRQSETSMFD
ncbi:hypothetical protein SAMD00019534_045030 [Acytostelium subglobosum LB1]|uniref:hypothetical protein n=1 Tax=Acytostelium subglobosum LB1 TaxID=1410327 RepID=UPI0006447D38|nr:hypothetical protein SAMD00019534_045030 [Acytostelium subglobosum LB1]GAM21328.1 hypothetical protein SAMD00019534_045030 [Acytostelium subglobosum LB1]|eukprot:XP_012755447.1 hypothetical protein SAMD00019534_045030 [Acytostelium subglobosum LB1]